MAKRERNEKSLSFELKDVYFKVSGGPVNPLPIISSEVKKIKVKKKALVVSRKSLACTSIQNMLLYIYQLIFLP